MGVRSPRHTSRSNKYFMEHGIPDKNNNTESSNIRQLAPYPKQNTFLHAFLHRQFPCATVLPFQNKSPNIKLHNSFVKMKSSQQLDVKIYFIINYMPKLYQLDVLKARIALPMNIRLENTSARFTATSGISHGSIRIQIRIQVISLIEQIQIMMSRYTPRA